MMNLGLRQRNRRWIAAGAAAIALAGTVLWFTLASGGQRTPGTAAVQSERTSAAAPVLDDTRRALDLAASAMSTTVPEREALAARAHATLAALTGLSSEDIFRTCEVMGGAPSPGLKAKAKAYYGGLPEAMRPPGLETATDRDLLLFACRESHPLAGVLSSTVRMTYFGESEAEIGAGVLHGRTEASKALRRMLGEPFEAATTRFAVTPPSVHARDGASAPVLPLVLVEFIGKDRAGRQGLFGVGMVRTPEAGWCPLYLGVTGEVATPPH